MIILILEIGRQYFAKNVGSQVLFVIGILYIVEKGRLRRVLFVPHILDILYDFEVVD